MRLKVNLAKPSEKLIKILPCFGVDKKWQENLSLLDTNDDIMTMYQHHVDKEIVRGTSKGHRQIRVYIHRNLKRDDVSLIEIESPVVWYHQHREADVDNTDLFRLLLI